ncbi:alpha-tubulin suppressor protein Aats1 [Echria macrotheca]|uniref:Alpha-tubulin suppressor protein Aats1 n=1 Tax=Echria macrotheca TaxID=438768 RepID=A0AAJ0F7X9_9PEZI|nr:alpha-tubulin suppressor protein Aats1 [Echria macrotheca]
MQQLFALGSNGSGQLGIGHREDVSVPKPVPLPPASSVTTIAAGGNHTLLLTSDGTLFGAGDATSGAIGSSPSDSQFHQLATASPVTHIAASWTASFFTTGSPPTALYALGTGLKGELGLGQLIIRTPSASLVPNFPPQGTHIVDLSASMAHAVAVLSDGSVWGWGAARKGQLGPVPGNEAVVYSPRKIDGVSFAVTRAICGKEFTCLFGTTDDGKMMILGSDKWGVQTKAPAATKISGWKDVGAGWSNVYVLCGDGTVVSWGRDDHGQMVPQDLSKAAKIAIGSEHALSLSDDGEVTAWGWGEHGNCGPGEAESGKGQRGVIASLKYAPKGSKITTIGAGCATSWVAIDVPEET